MNGDKMFAIAWRESGGPPAKTPRRKGFGSTILVDGATKFGKDAKLRFDQEGLRYELRRPLNTIETTQAMPASHDCHFVSEEPVFGVRLCFPDVPTTARL